MKRRDVMRLCLAVVACISTVWCEGALAPDVLPDTVQEVLTRSLSMVGTASREGEGLKVYQAPSKKGESPIYFIRLPPTKPFYTKRAPYKGKIGTKVPLNFTINGRPHKVYHYNLPYHKKVDQYRRHRLPFHPFNHRPATQTYRAFITKLELSVPKPETGLALPVLDGSKPGTTASLDGTQPLMSGLKPVPVKFKTGYSPLGTAENELKEVKLPLRQPDADANAHGMEKFTDIFPQKTISEEKSPFAELGFPGDENSLLGDQKFSTKSRKNINLGFFDGKSQEKSQETFFVSAPKTPDKIPPQGEEAFTESAEKFDSEVILPGKKFMEAAKSRAQKISWAT